MWNFNLIYDYRLLKIREAGISSLVVAKSWGKKVASMSKEVVLYSNHDFQNSGEKNRLKEYKVTVLISHAKYNI